MEKKTLFLIICLGLAYYCTLEAQVKKQLIGVTSVKIKETIGLKYNARNQLIFIEEKSPSIYREISLTYGQDGILYESSINQDKGELVSTAKYIYESDGYIIEEVKIKNKKTEEESSAKNKIFFDEKGRLTKSTFRDSGLWEEFKYEESGNNISQYIIHSPSGKNDVFTNYEYENDKSIFYNISFFPYWFFTLHMNQLTWYRDFASEKNPVSITIKSPGYEEESIKVSYQYDPDGYPIKQFYNGELMKEFTYKSIW